MISFHVGMFICWVAVVITICFIGCYRQQKEKDKEKIKMSKVVMKSLSKGYKEMSESYTWPERF